MKAYDFGFGTDPGALSAHPEHNKPLVLPGAVEVGWCGGRGPAISTDAWPRSPISGYPMVHLFTIRLPEEYQLWGPQSVALSMFQADDHVAEGVDGVAELFEAESAEETAEPETPYLQAVATYLAERHAEQLDLEDLIGGHFAAIWLTEAEFTGERIDPPADNRDDEEGDHLNAWDDSVDEVPMWIAERTDDPNIGVTPVEFAAEGDEYTDVFDDAHTDWYKAHHGRTHLGGTALPAQAMPELTPYFLEFEEIGGANLGGGNAQFDLKTGKFDWAC